MLKDVQLSEGDEINVIAYHENGIHTWYPTGESYTVLAGEAGTCKIRFRPDAYFGED